MKDNLYPLTVCTTMNCKFKTNCGRNKSNIKPNKSHKIQYMRPPDEVDTLSYCEFQIPLRSKQ